MILKRLLLNSNNIFRRYGGLCQCGMMSLLSNKTTMVASNRYFAQQTDVANQSNDTAYQLGSFVGNMKQNITKYMAQGLTSKNLYECCADGISYEDFVTVCQMPDTFQSWFYVMQLHLWLILVRLRPEGKFGKNISYKMVEIMWQDVEARMKLIGVEDTSERRETMEEYAQQFFGLIAAYDEGLLGHDRVLASALWRNMFYNKQTTDAENLAAIVGYVRKQIQHLERQNSDDIIMYGKIDWLPLQEHKPKHGKRDIPDPG